VRKRRGAYENHRWDPGKTGKVHWVKKGRSMIKEVGKHMVNKGNRRPGPTWGKGGDKKRRGTPKVFVKHPGRGSLAKKHDRGSHKNFQSRKKRRKTTTTKGGVFSLKKIPREAGERKDQKKGGGGLKGKKRPTRRKPPKQTLVRCFKMVKGPVKKAECGEKKRQAPHEGSGLWELTRADKTRSR